MGKLEFSGISYLIENIGISKLYFSVQPLPQKINFFTKSIWGIFQISVYFLKKTLTVNFIVSVVTINFSSKITFARFYVATIFPYMNCVKSVHIRSFFWSLFSCIWTEYGHLRSKSPYSVQIQDNTDQK